MSDQQNKPIEYFRWTTTHKFYGPTAVALEQAHMDAARECREIVVLADDGRAWSVHPNGDVKVINELAKNE
jgi:hypothetical protein